MLGQVLLAMSLLAPVEVLSHSSSRPAKVEWTADLAEGLERAAEEGRVVLVALGAVEEARSAAHVKELYSSKKLSAYFEAAVNIPAWSCALGEERALPRFSKLEPEDHVNNLIVATERWLKPNSKGVVPLPQHLWVSPEGELLLSCPYEIDVEEFAWCFDEALRRAGVDERPEPVKGAHPPRRLLFEDVLALGDEDDLGRGLTSDELDALLKEMNKRFLTERDRGDVIRVLFTDDDSAVSFLGKQFGLWELGGPRIAPIIDGTFELLGTISSKRYIEVLEAFATHNRASLRARVAVAFEQIGHPDGLSTVKKALKKEKDDEVRAEWVRALGACGFGQKSALNTLAKLAEKEKDDRVRRNAILALGHLLPAEGAFDFLTELLGTADGEDRSAAILALALGRATGARELIAGFEEGEDDEDVLKLIRRSLKVLDGGNLYEIQSSFSLISESEVGRARLFFRPGGVPTGGERGPEDELRRVRNSSSGAWQSVLWLTSQQSVEPLTPCGVSFKSSGALHAPE